MLLTEGFFEKFFLFIYDNYYDLVASRSPNGLPWLRQTGAVQISWYNFCLLPFFIINWLL